MILQLIYKKSIKEIIKHILKRYDLLFLVLGLIISSATLSCTIMLFEGYERALKQTILNFNAHIYFFQPGSNDLDQKHVNQISHFLKNDPRVESYQPVVMGQGMIISAQKMKGVNFRSVRFKQKNLPIAYHQIIISGNGNLENESSAVIGSQIAKDHHIALGDTIFIMTSGSQEFDINQIRQVPLIVQGIFKSGMYEYDSKNIFVNESFSHSLSQNNEQFNLLEVSLKNEYIEEAKDIAIEWDRKFQGEYQIYSWIDYNGNIFSLLKLEKWVIGIILFFLIIIASFSIITSSITTINEDSKKIAILRTLGLKIKQIYFVYLLRIIVIGIVSVITGLLCGYLIAQIISHQNIIKMYGEVYLLDAFHVNISIESLLIIFFASLISISISAMIALKQIFKLDIISILRMKK